MKIVYHQQRTLVVLWRRTRTHNNNPSFQASPTIQRSAEVRLVFRQEVGQLVIFGRCWHMSLSQSVAHCRTSDWCLSESVRWTLCTVGVAREVGEAQRCHEKHESDGCDELDDASVQTGRAVRQTGHARWRDCGTRRRPALVQHQCPVARESRCNVVKQSQAELEVTTTRHASRQVARTWPPEQRDTV